MLVICLCEFSVTPLLKRQLLLSCSYLILLCSTVVNCEAGFFQFPLCFLDVSIQLLLRLAAYHKLNMELDLKSLFGLLQLYSLAETPQPTPCPPHLGSYTRVLLVSQNRRHLFVTPCCILLLRNLYGNSMLWQLQTLWTIGGCCLAVGAAAPHCCRKFLISTLKNSFSSGSLFYHFSLLPFIRSSVPLYSVLPFLHFYIPYSSVIQCHCSPFLLSSVPPWSLYSKISKRKHCYSKLMEFSFLSARENECNHTVIQYNCSGKEAVWYMIECRFS
jgi:hypothetical protein